MGGISQTYEWLAGEPRMNMKQIAAHEGVKYATIKFWMHDCGGDVKLVKKRLERFHRKGYKKRAKLYPYRDGKEYTMKQIQKMEPHLSVGVLQRRYRIEEPGDWDAIFAPPGKRGGNNHHRKIDSKHLQGLGPRGDLSKIPNFTEYERRLWELG